MAQDPVLSYGSALRRIVSRANALFPKNRAVDRLRSMSKASLRHSPTESMKKFKRALEGVHGFSEALSTADYAFFVERESVLGVNGLGSLFLQTTPEDKLLLWNHFIDMCNAAFSEEKVVEAHARWSRTVSCLLGKSVTINVETGGKIDGILSLCIDFFNAKAKTPEDIADILDGVDLENVAAHDGVKGVLSGLLERLPKDLDPKTISESIPSFLESSKARPAIGALHKICKKVDNGALERIIDGIVSQLRVNSIDELVGSCQSLDISVLSGEMAVLSKCIQQQEVIEALRGLLTEVDPATLKMGLAAAMGGAPGREAGSDVLRQVLKSDLIPGLAAQAPAIFKEDGTIDMDKLVTAITRPGKLPKAPRLSMRR